MPKRVEAVNRNQSPQETYNNDSRYNYGLKEGEYLDANATRETTYPQLKSYSATWANDKYTAEHHKDHV